MDPEVRERVKKFHLKMTFVFGLMMMAASLAGGYIVFFRKDPNPPAFLTALARWFGS